METGWDLIMDSDTFGILYPEIPEQYPFTRELFMSRENYTNAMYVISYVTAHKYLPEHDKYFKWFQEIAHKHYPPQSQILYRGTHVEKEALATIIKGKPFTLTAQEARSFRSWTTDVNVAKRFANTYVADAIGLLLKEMVPVNQMIIDWTVDGILQEFRALEKLLSNASDYDNPIAGNLFNRANSIIYFIQTEKEIIRWVKPQAYSLCKEIIRISAKFSETPHEDLRTIANMLDPDDRQEFKDSTLR